MKFGKHFSLYTPMCNYIKVTVFMYAKRFSDVKRGTNNPRCRISSRRINILMDKCYDM
jgi:hypothetical protein